MTTSPGRQPGGRGGRAVLHGGDRRAAAGLGLRRLLPALHAEDRLGRAAGVEDLLGDAAGLVDRDREAQADAAAALAGGRDGRVDADHLPVEVDQRATGVALVDRGVGLQAVVDDGRAVVALDADRAVQRADDARGDGARQALRRADRDDLLAHLQVRAAAQRRRGQPGDVLHAQHGEVVAGGGAHDGRGVLGAVGERDGDRAVRPGDDVVVREDGAVRGEDDAAALGDALGRDDPDVDGARRGGRRGAGDGAVGGGCGAGAGGDGAERGSAGLVVEQGVRAAETGAAADEPRDQRGGDHGAHPAAAPGALGGDHRGRERGGGVRAGGALGRRGACPRSPERRRTRVRGTRGRVRRDAARATSGGRCHAPRSSYRPPSRCSSFIALPRFARSAAFAHALCRRFARELAHESRLRRPSGRNL